jgi:hypothetical protein
VLRGDPLHVRAAEHEAVRAPRLQQVVGQPAGEDVVAAVVVPGAVGDRGDAHPGQRVGADLPRARAGPDVVGERQRAVLELQRLELVEQLGLGAVAEVDERERRQRVVGGLLVLVARPRLGHVAAPALRAVLAGGVGGGGQRHRREQQEDETEDGTAHADGHRQHRARIVAP